MSDPTRKPPTCTNADCDVLVHLPGLACVIHGPRAQLPPPDRRRDPAARRQRRKARALAIRIANRAAVVSIYGGACTWCGWAASANLLEFDHVNDDGKAHRAVEQADTWLARVARLGRRDPDWELQLLCIPCHRAAGWKARRATATPALTCTNTEE